MQRVSTQPSDPAAGSLAAFLERRGLLLAVGVGLVARLAMTSALFQWDAVPTSSDDETYAKFALGLLRTGHLESHHMPVGYPFYVALVLKLSGGSFAAVRATHVLFGVGTVALVSKVAGVLYGRRAGLAAAWLTALYPPLVFMTGRVMSETLFIFLLMASLLQLLIGDRDASTGRTVAGGALFAVASVVRSNLLVMLPFLPLWILARPGAAFPVKLRRAVLCGAVAGAIVLLPGLYFLLDRGEFIPSATNAGQTFYGANNQYANGGWVHFEDHPDLIASIPPSVAQSAQAYSKAQFQLGLQWIRREPGAFLRLLPKKLANAWVPGLQVSETTSGSKLALFVFNLSSGLLLLGAIGGRLLVRPARRDGILLAVPATYTLMSLAFYGNPRIGLFCSPVLIVYGASIVARVLGPPEPAEGAKAPITAPGSRSRAA